MPGPGAPRHQMFMIAAASRLMHPVLVSARVDPLLDWALVGEMFMQPYIRVVTCIRPYLQNVKKNDDGWRCNIDKKKRKKQREKNDSFLCPYPEMDRGCRACRPILSSSSSSARNRSRQPVPSRVLHTSNLELQTRTRCIQQSIIRAEGVPATRTANRRTTRS